MKKLLFTIAAAASFAALANPIAELGFEYYANDTGVVGKDDQGGTTGSSWYINGADEDSSLVKPYGIIGDVTNATAPSITVPYPGSFTDGGTKYLSLDTNGGELQRFLNSDTNLATTVGDDGIYIDTLVQFTVTEDDAPNIDGAKLAIWLQAENGTTNLMVAGARYILTDPDDTQSLTITTSTNYTVSGTFDPNTWYRLTVKAIPTIVNGEGQYLPGFVIYVDGQMVSTVESATDGAAYDVLTGDSGLISGANKDLIDNKQFIPALGVSDPTVPPTITSVGFQGTGALDDFVITTETPDFGSSAVDFTLTWGEGVSAVSYVLSADMTTTNTLTSGTAAQIPAGTTGTIELIPTFASGYEFDYVDMGGTQFGLTFAVPTESTNAALVAKASEVKLSFTLAWGSNIDGVTYTVNGGESQTATNGTLIEVDPNAAIVVTVTYAANYQAASGNPTTSFTVSASGSTYTYNAEPIPAAYPTYIDTSDATIKAKYDAWKTKVGYDDTTASSHLNQFLLDVDEETTVGDAALEITEIKQNETAGWDITIGCTVSGASLTGTVGSTIVCNGYLAVSYTDSLTGTWTTENIAITAVDTTTGTVTVNVNKNNAKFMKVSLTAAPATQE